MRRFLLCTSLFVAACGGTSEPKSDPGLDAGSTTSGLTLEDACAKFAEVICTGLRASCEVSSTIQIYADAPTCLAGEKRSCLDAHARPGRVADPARLAACAEVAMEAECPVRALEGDCLPPGTLPNGAACLDHAQCADGFCRTFGFHESAGGPCGVCGGSKAGDACNVPGSIIDCMDEKGSLYCEPATNTCAAWKSAPLGAACGEPAVLCEPGAHCNGGVCVANLPAEPEPEPEYVGLGEACGWPRLCRGGGRCVGGVCVAAQSAYGPCTTSKDCSRFLGCHEGVCTPVWEYCK